jgi:hypothetical protein
VVLDRSQRALPFTTRLNVFFVVKHTVGWAPGTSVAVLDLSHRAVPFNTRLDVFLSSNTSRGHGTRLQQHQSGPQPNLQLICYCNVHSSGFAVVLRHVYFFITLGCAHSGRFCSVLPGQALMVVSITTRVLPRPATAPSMCLYSPASEAPECSQRHPC